MNSASLITKGQAARMNARRALDRRRNAITVWGLWAFTLVLALIALFLRTTNQSLIEEPLPGAQQLGTLLYWMILIPAAVPAYGTVGAVLSARRPRNRIGWLCQLFALGIVLEDVSWLYAFSALYAAPGSLPGGQFVAWAGGAVYALAILPFAYLLFSFPTGKLASWRWLPAVGVVVLGCLLQTLGLLFRPTLQIGMQVAVPNPVLPVLPNAVVETLFITGEWLTYLGLLLGLVSVIVRWVKAQGEQRLQLTWLAYAGAIILVCGILSVAGLTLSGGESYAAVLIGAVGLAALTLGVPLAIGVAVLKYRLYEIDLLVNRTLVYGVLTASVVIVYVAVVSVLGTQFSGGASQFISLVATGLIVVLFQPVRTWVQQGVNRLLYGERDDPYGVITRLGRRLENTLAPDAVLPTIVETVAQALKLPYAAVLFFQGDEPVVASVYGDETRGNPETNALITLPLVYQNDTVGQLILAPRSPQEPFSLSDQRLLADLARQAGMAVHAVRLTSDLRRSRERLITAREEERRRLRRDLHDGLGPELASHTLKLEAARDLLQIAPDKAVQLLQELTVQSQSMISEIRRLVYALRPPTLDELGLVAAIKEQATQYTSSHVEITTHMPERLPALPAAIEVASYRITQEALTNIVKHAQAQHCTIWLALDEVALTMEITDDGVGIPTGHRVGVGLHSMRERAEELGGVCRVVPARGGGTSVLVWLPLESP